MCRWVGRGGVCVRRDARCPDLWELLGYPVTLCAWARLDSVCRGPRGRRRRGLHRRWQERWGGWCWLGEGWCWRRCPMHIAKQPMYSKTRGFSGFDRFSKKTVDLVGSRILRTFVFWNTAYIYPNRGEIGEWQCGIEWFNLPCTPFVHKRLRF
jgi:hypothetical protein